MRVTGGMKEIIDTNFHEWVRMYSNYKGLNFIDTILYE